MDSNTIITIFFLFGNIVLAFAAPSSKYEVCKTDACLRAASNLRDSIDTSVNPCDDFYEFACGGWVQKHPIPKDQISVSQFQLLTLRTYNRLREILEDSPKPEDTEALGLARKLYKMCMDTDTLRQVGVRALEDELVRFGGWPMTIPFAEWNQNDDVTWQQIRGNIDRTYLQNGIFTVGVTIDNKNSDRYLTVIMEPLLLSRDLLLEMEKNVLKRALYAKYIVQIAQIFARAKGAAVSYQSIRQDVEAMIQFEIELAKRTRTNEQRRDLEKNYNLMTLAELQKKYDAQNPEDNAQINWVEVIRNVFANTEITIDPSEEVLVHGVEYLMKLVPLLNKTPARTIVNYMQWQVVRQLVQYVDTETERMTYDMMSELELEAHEQPDRWKTCVQRNSLGAAVSYEYIERYSPKEFRVEAARAIDDIGRIVVEQIKASSWMDEKTKKVSIDKLYAMQAHVAKPDWYNRTAINKYYEGISITSQYLESVMNTIVFQSRQHLNKLRNPVNKHEWLIDPTIVNAMYTPNSNAIFITAGILQDPVFETNRPDFLNYGGLGVIIGHEISHGFDNNGRKFDKNGNSVQWWTDETVEAYEEITQCFVDQYNRFIIPELKKSWNRTVHVNGRLTLGENIGDSAGALAAFRAYKKRVQEHGNPDVRLPGLEEYTGDQLFFVSFANEFCENASPVAVHLLLSNEHPRSSARIRGSLSNMREFAETFRCPVGKGMNPIEKCTLWE